MYGSYALQYLLYIINSLIMTYFNSSDLTKNLRTYVECKLNVGYKINNQKRNSITNVISTFI